MGAEKRTVFVLDGFIFVQYSSPWEYLQYQLGITISSFTLLYSTRSLVSIDEYEAAHREMALIRCVSRQNPIQVMKRLFGLMPLIEGIQDLFSVINSMGGEWILAGGIPKPFCERIIKEAKLEPLKADIIWYYETENPFPLPIKYGRTKAYEFVRNSLAEVEASWEDVIAVARDRFFSKVLEKARIGIALNPNDDEIVKVADRVVRGSLKDLVPILQEEMLDYGPGRP